MADVDTPVHALEAEQVLQRWSVDREVGLRPAEVHERRDEYGANRLQKTETRSWWRILLLQFRSMVIYLLVGAAVLAYATAHWPEAIAVTAVIVVNAGIGFVSEWRAVRSMAALRRLGEHRTRVRREGREQDVPAPELVPGDIVLLAAGDLVPADLRLVQAEGVRVDQAALTGESVPADRGVAAVEADIELADRAGMLYKGTEVVDGGAEGVVVATGGATELGRIARLAEEAESSVPPLQERLDRLGRRLGWLTIAIAIGLAAIGLLIRQQDSALVIETALALGVAAIPEGLPIVATIGLARGMWLMAQRNALVNRLTAVETLGATQLILSDKTGTLTENQMRLRKVATAGGEQAIEAEGAAADELEPLIRRAILIGVLCNGASLGEDGEEPQGDPTEIALLAGGRCLGRSRPELLDEWPEERVVPFDHRSKQMATYHRQDDGLFVAVKGAPEAVLEASVRLQQEGDGGTVDLDEEGRKEWLRRVDELAGQGLRVLAVAEKRVADEEVAPYEDLTLIGLVGLLDPPRAGVREAINGCQAAGIRVGMVTGDQPATANAIAHEVGIVGDADDPAAVVIRGRDIGSPEELDEEGRQRIRRGNVFARVAPEQKLDLVTLFQEGGEVVAVTGDGVNDAPALKKADIGIAMGKRGTESAKQVADMVLKDDAFGTIVAAVEQGRVIFDNIRKSVLFMLCTNVAEVIAVATATMAKWTLPLHPLQILYLNVVTDVFPALALGVGPGAGDEMRRPPRPTEEDVLTRRHWQAIVGWALLLAGCVLAALLLAEGWLGLPREEAVTVSFLTLAFGKLWFTFNLRSPGSGVFRNEVTSNPWVWAAILLCLGLLMLAVFLPVLAGVLQTRSPGPAGWLLLLGMSLIPFIFGQVLRLVQGRRGTGGKAG